MCVTHLRALGNNHRISVVLPNAFSKIFIPWTYKINVLGYLLYLYRSVGVSHTYDTISI